MIGRRSTDEIKQFTVTINFYSPKICNFLKHYLYLSHPLSIKQWISSVDASPGFLSEVFEDSRIKIQGKPGRSDCALLADGMVIRKEIICYIINNLPICQGRYVAFVHYDNIAPENSKIIAFRALVDMLVMEMPSWLFF